MISCLIVTVVLIFNMVLWTTVFYEPLYVYIFEHKDYKWFKLFNKCNDYEFIRKSFIDYIFNSKTYPDFIFYVDINNEAWVWDNKTDKLVVSTFYKKGSRKLAKKLLK